MGGSREKLKGRLEPRCLYHRVNPRQLRFSTTAELEPLEGVIEQDRAIKALETGLRLRRRNFNIFVAGASGTGKSSILKGMLRRLAAQDPVPPDWCMVNNFKRPDIPIVFSLPAGHGAALQKGMDSLVADLKVEMPKAFHGKTHQERIQRILNEGLEAENRGFLALTQEAQKIGFQVKSTKDGLITIPVVNGKQIGNKEYNALTEQERSQVEANRQKLEPIVSHFLETTRETELAVHQKIQESQRGLGREVVERCMKPLRQMFGDHAEVMQYLDAVAGHVVDNLPRFLPDESDPQKAERAMRRPMIEYQVNVLVDNSDTKGAPVIFENTPTYHNLIGKIEKRVENGIYSTDFTMVKAGALVRANGGYLVLHAAEVLSFPFAYDALKVVLRHQKVQIEEMGEQFQFLPTSGLRPDPIPVQCKVILIGSNYLYHLLINHDEEFSKAFQVKAEFDSEVRRTPRTLMEYARFVATSCRRDELLPVDRDGVAAVAEFGARVAGDQERMTLRFNEICNLLIEADAVARSQGATVITRKHIETANRQRLHRVSLIADKSRDEIVEGTVHVDTEGTEIGTVNGLAVFRFADLTFGRPLRITARTFQGKAGVINVEREARLSGSIHNKGVLILAGYLGGTFAQEKPLTLSVSLTVEQSYGMIDGDSASCAELCAILSSLSDVPVHQELAITGSVSQKGEVQAIGGVNEKIEGFFQVCKATGLTGSQGVLIPATNVRHLMLDREVIDAVRAGLFHVHAIETVADAIRLLTGMPAGERQEDGSWTEGSVFAKVAAKLAKYAEKEEDEKGKKRKKGE